MKFDQFISDAKRTESVPDVVRTNDVMFESLQSSVGHLMDCLDLIKKNVYYDKPINVDRFIARLTVAVDTITTLKNRCQENTNFINVRNDVVIDPREFHGILGLLTEAGELLELANLHRTNANVVNIADELGDAFWYIAILADTTGLDIEEQVLEAVIAKLRKRFPDKFEAALAVSRDKDVEIAETANVVGITELVVPEEATGPIVSKKKTSKKKTSKKKTSKKKVSAKKDVE